MHHFIDQTLINVATEMFDSKQVSWHHRNMINSYLVMIESVLGDNLFSRSNCEDHRINDCLRLTHLWMFEGQVIFTYDVSFAKMMIEPSCAILLQFLGALLGLLRFVSILPRKVTCSSSLDLLRTK